MKVIPLRLLLRCEQPCTDVGSVTFMLKASGMIPPSAKASCG